MSIGYVQLERDPYLFESLAPTTSTGISAILLNPKDINGGPASAHAATTITLASGASTSDDAYVNWKILITGGTGAGQERLITIYVGSTLVATVTPEWTTHPSTDSYYRLIPPTEQAAQEALVTVETNPVRFRVDGGAPTAGVGHTVAAGGSVTIKGAAALKKLRFIDTATGASSLRVSLFY